MNNRLPPLTILPGPSTVSSHGWLRTASHRHGKMLSDISISMALTFSISVDQQSQTCQSCTTPFILKSAKSAQLEAYTTTRILLWQTENEPGSLFGTWSRTLP